MHLRCSTADNTVLNITFHMTYRKKWTVQKVHFTDDQSNAGAGDTNSKLNGKQSSA